MKTLDDVDRSPGGATSSAGLALAGMTAAVSGVAVFLNGYGVRHWDDATAYTTAKNLVAAVLLGAALLARARATDARRTWPRPGVRPAALLVAVIGGSVPFALFFEGLARASSADAAFLHKTLVVWVALLAVPFLGERLTGLHLLAVAALVSGQAALTGGLPDVATGSGEAMILAATLLWSVEVVLARRLLATVEPLTLGVVRMGGGVALLALWLVARGDLGALASAGSVAWGWALATGAILAVYVAAWYGALARARAVDVTAVLVPAALLTALLDVSVRGMPAPEPVAVVLLAVGAVLIATAARRTGPRRAEVPA